MLSDTLLASLPDDPELAFIELVDQLDAWLLQNENSQYGFRSEPPDCSNETMYGDVIRAFADEYNLAAAFRAYDRSDFDNDWAWWTRFSQDVRYLKSRLQFRHKLGTRMLPASSLSLNEERRAEIHGLLNKIRKVVAVLEVTQKKRDALYSRIAALAREVDTSNTRFGTLMGLILEASETAGKATEEASPLIKLVHRVVSVVADQRAETEQQRLPAPPTQKQISGPTQDLDDELPF